jgi:hypothetical protein
MVLLRLIEGRGIYSIFKLCSSEVCRGNVVDGLLLGCRFGRIGRRSWMSSWSLPTSQRISIVKKNRLCTSNVRRIRLIAVDESVG